LPTTLAQFITSSIKQISAEWEEFARGRIPGAMPANLDARRDHIEGMLLRIAQDLETPQTKREQADKATGVDDDPVTSRTAANAHGTDRAARGFSPSELIAEFRALRASVLRLWTETQGEFTRVNLSDVMRFNEAVDQVLAESATRYTQDIDRATDLFIGVLGHDLRNPLGAIMMSATVMMAKEGPEWPHAKSASRILSAGARMEGLIGDLVDFTRSRLGTGIPVDRAPMDLGLIARLTVDEVRAFHPECSVHFYSSGDMHGEWDSKRIGQALSNLLGNAFQHGADEAPIDVTVRGEPDSVVVSVRNQGAQIPGDRIGDIFDPFRQLAPGSHKSLQARSAGLGLYIVQAIIDAHDGTISVESTSEGTTFSVRLPRTYRRA
jgi:signal transduction histidine kinase